MRVCWLVPLLAACARGSAGSSDASAPDDGNPTGDGMLDDAAEPDAPPPDASVMPSSHLLLTEVALTPYEKQFVEIYNPGAQAVALANYYVTDVPTYFRLPAGSHTIPAGDFIVRFPPSATIAAGAVITVALATASQFNSVYGSTPTYAMTSGTLTVTNNGMPDLANGGEMVALFYWDGASDLVTDVDMVIVGALGSSESYLNKSNVALDGPDAGAATTAYKMEAATMPPPSTTPGVNVSTKRVKYESGFEVRNGTGNGIAGDDETSENIAQTWDTMYTAPTPGTITIQ
ncbi:MAG: lamin tail domain-containing protein [Kofleriaceae bacterium]